MDQEVITKISAALDAAERSKRWTADKAGIAYSTFHRKMSGGGSFTVPEIARIAAALGIEAASLLPAPFTSHQLAAA